MVIEPKLLRGRFSDRGQAQDALDLLMGTGDNPSADVDVAFYGSNGEYLLLVIPKDSQVERWAAQVLRDYGATLEEQRFTDWLARSRNELMHQASGVSGLGSEENALRTRWVTLAFLLMERGVLKPPDLLALLLTSRRLSSTAPSDVKRRRLGEADEELREVIERLEVGLRAHYPELFDRRGRLRPAALTRHLSARTGGKEILSGDELSLLEDAEDAVATRSGRAP